MTNLTETIETKKTAVLEYEGRTMEVKLPYYCKTGELFIRVERRYKAIAVHNYDFNTAVEITDGRYHGTIIDQTKPCTKEEFDFAFQTALTKIQNIQL